jgi:hypothetical protein
MVALCRENVDYTRAIPNQKKKGYCAVGRTMGKRGQERRAQNEKVGGKELNEGSMEKRKPGSFGLEKLLQLSTLRGRPPHSFRK